LRASRAQHCLGAKGETGVAAFIRLAKPIPFDAPDRQPVGQLLILLTPEASTQQHLDILAEVARLFSNEALRSHLAIEADPAVVHALLTEDIR
jgi:PTS system nitrogen regulatory IIA component